MWTERWLGKKQGHIPSCSRCCYTAVSTSHLENEWGLKPVSLGEHLKINERSNNRANQDKLEHAHGGISYNYTRGPVQEFVQGWGPSSTAELRRGHAARAALPFIWTRAAGASPGTALWLPGTCTVSSYCPSRAHSSPWLAVCVCVWEGMGGSGELSLSPQSRNGSAHIVWERIIFILWDLMGSPPHPIFNNVANEPERRTNIIHSTQLLT